jgi:hypothetical protein
LNGAPLAIGTLSLTQLATPGKSSIAVETVIEGVRVRAATVGDLGPETVSKHFCTEGNARTQPPSVPRRLCPSRALTHALRTL